MNDEQVNEIIRLLKNIDWKLWEMHKMMKNVLDPENDDTGVEEQ